MLGGESFKLNNSAELGSISSSAQKRIQLGLGWPNTQCGASRGSQRVRRHFIVEVKNVGSSIHCPGRFRVYRIGLDPSVLNLVQPLAHKTFWASG